MIIKPDTKDVVTFLNRIGIDSRFVSIMGNQIFVNNQRFSRFSNKRQEAFIRKFPDFTISRSNIFQKICTRASRVLANSLKPGEIIFIQEDHECSNFILNVIMEPYRRKYGIKIINGSVIDEAVESDADSIALPLTLDNEVENILGNCLKGERIEVSSLKNKYNAENNLKLIYPLINVPRSWLVYWLEKLDYEYKYPKTDDYVVDLVNFLEEFIPDVRENILRSAKYVFNECVYD